MKIFIMNDTQYTHVDNLINYFRKYRRILRLLSANYSNAPTFKSRAQLNRTNAALFAIFSIMDFLKN